MACPARIPPNASPGLRLCLMEMIRCAGRCLCDGDYCSARVPPDAGPELAQCLNEMIRAIEECDCDLISGSTSISFTPHIPSTADPDLRLCLEQLARCIDGCNCEGSGSGSGGSGGSGSGGSGGSGSGGSGGSGSGGSGGPGGSAGARVCIYVYRVTINCASGGLNTPTLVVRRCNDGCEYGDLVPGEWTVDARDPCTYYILICEGPCTSTTECPDEPEFIGTDIFDDYPLEVSVGAIDDCCEGTLDP